MNSEAQLSRRSPLIVVSRRYLHHWSMMSSGRPVVPALGLAWANCVNTRIFLTRKTEFATGQRARGRSDRGAHGRQQMQMQYVKVRHSPR